MSLPIPTMHAEANTAHRRDSSTSSSLQIQYSSDLDSDSSLERDQSVTVSPRKRRRRMRSFTGEGSSNQVQTQAVGCAKSLSGWSSTQGAFEVDSDDASYDTSLASINSLDAIERLVSNSDAPTIAAAYQPDTSKPNATQFECFPLACFYSRPNSTGRSSCSDRFDLSLNDPLSSSCGRTGQAGTLFAATSKALISSKASKSRNDTLRSTPLSRPGAHPSKRYLPSRKRTSPHLKNRIIDPSRIPVEVFELIAQHLSLRDVKNMRLVDRAFERGVSGQLFENVIVPFNIDIYGALASQDLYTNPAVDLEGKGKAQLRQTTEDFMRIATTKQQKEQLDVFGGFGPHIRRFGISFVVNEQELITAKPKEVHQKHNVYWGDFRWPFPDYPRFQDRASLESTADRTSTMKDAFRHLHRVKHLALSVDSGLGWLSGGDVSLRSKILSEPRHPFTKFKRPVEPEQETRRRFWSMLEGAYETAQNKSALKMAELVRHEQEDVASLVSSERLVNVVRLSQNVIQDASQESMQRKFSHSPRLKGKLEQLLQESKPQLPSSISSAIANFTETSSRDSSPSAPTSWSRSNVLDFPNVTLSSTANATTRAQSSSALRNLAMSPIGRLRRRGRNPDTPVHDQASAGPTATEPQNIPQDETSSRTTEAENIANLVKGMPVSTERGRSIRKAGNVQPQKQSGPARSGILFTRPLKQDSNDFATTTSISDHYQLNQSQREWLMETAWAQDAFLSSYMISVADNSDMLRSVRTLTLSPFSSGHLTKLLRPDFWDSLPSLDSLELVILPDWRRIERHPAGYTSAPTLNPTKALDTLCYVLDNTIASRENIRNLTLGWGAGGEHAEGMNARNRLLMPAPITQRNGCLPLNDFGLSILMLPHIEKLTLVNCWVAPNVLLDWIRQHLSRRLGDLTLESVSLTAHPKYPTQGAGAAQGGFGTAAAAAAMGNLPNAGANAFHQMLQQMQQQMQQAQNNGNIGFAQVPTVAQLQNQLQNFAPNAIPFNAQNLQNHAAAFPGAPAAIGAFHPQLQPNPQAPTSQPRDGSWPVFLSRIQNWSSLLNKALNVTFASCGYALLHRAAFDQSEIELSVLSMTQLDSMLDRHTQAWFTSRRNTLSETLLQSSDGLLGKVVTWLPLSDIRCLEDVWRLYMGWPRLNTLGDDEYEDQNGWGKWGCKTKEAAEYDGERSGGSGRFSGRISFSPWSQGES